MKLKFLILEGKPPAWVAEGRAEYLTKIQPFVSIELKSLRSPAADRDNAEVKRKREGELILKEVDSRDLLILFDERGKVAKNSEDFSAQLGRVLESGKQVAIFCIGGAYGFSDDVYARADMKWSLSPLTMNHWLAAITALEQIYRGFTILRNIPYHNR